MNHLVFIIHEKYLEYRMGNRTGSHPFFDDPPQKVIDYILSMVKPQSHEVITH